MEKQNYSVGNIIKHPKFGVGKVVEIKGTGDNSFIVIKFEDANIGTKSLMNKFAPLEILDNTTTELNPQPTKEEAKENKVLQSYFDGGKWLSEKRFGRFDKDGTWDEDLPAEENGVEKEIRLEIEKQKKKANRKPTTSKTLTIKDKVIAAKDELTKMTTHGELRNWAISNGMDNRSAFPKFKDALNEIGMDYDEIKQGIKKVKEEELQSKLKYQVELFVDAKASAGMYGITDKDGNVLWYGKFFPDDDAGEQSRAELAAAKKAVWLASKIKEAINQEAIELYLNVDAQWLIYQDHAGQKGYALTSLANKYNIKLHVQWVKGTENPADEWTTASGYKKWADNDLKSLPELIENIEEMGTFAGKVDKETMHKAFIPNLPVKVGGYTDEEIKAHREKFVAPTQFKGIHHDYKDVSDFIDSHESEQPSEKKKAKSSQSAQSIYDKVMYILHNHHSLDELSTEQIDLLKNFEGKGGLQIDERGILDQYFTPIEICQKMWQIAERNGFNPDKGLVLEPSAGNGRFIETKPPTTKITAFEIDEQIFKVLKFLYGGRTDVTLYNQYFETAFLQPERYVSKLKGDKSWLPQFDLIIGNPPYGKHKNKYSSYFPKYSQVEIFFIQKGLELLKPNGLLVYITASNFLRNGVTYNAAKEEMEKIATFVEAYRMPNKLFGNTDVGTDILVYRKK